MLCANTLTGDMQLIKVIEKQMRIHLFWLEPQSSHNSSISVYCHRQLMTHIDSLC